MSYFSQYAESSADLRHVAKELRSMSGYAPSEAYKAQQLILQAADLLSDADAKVVANEL